MKIWSYNNGVGDAFSIYEGLTEYPEMFDSFELINMGQSTYNTYGDAPKQMLDRAQCVVKLLNSGIYSGIEPAEFCKAILG